MAKKQVKKRARRDPLVKRVEDALPTSWLDGILTGPNAVIGKQPYDCKDIERVLLAVNQRVRAALKDRRHRV